MHQRTSELTGKVAVVTGGTQGLGLAIAHAFAEAGATVVVANHMAAEVQRAVMWLEGRGVHVLGQLCDVRNRAQVFALAHTALSTFGQLDVWVNNAGVTATQGPTALIAPTVFTRVIETNILGTYHGSLAALHAMRPRRTGKLINLVGQGEKTPNPFGNAYGASKAWIRNFTLALATEERANGLGIFTLNPGLLDTPLTRRMAVVAGYEGRARAFNRIARLVAAPPEEAARLALWLAGPATNGRTGLALQAPVLPRLLRGLVRETAHTLLRHPTTPWLSYQTVLATTPTDQPL